MRSEKEEIEYWISKLEGDKKLLQSVLGDIEYVRKSLEDLLRRVLGEEK